MCQESDFSYSCGHTAMESWLVETTWWDILTTIWLAVSQLWKFMPSYSRRQRPQSDRLSCFLISYYFRPCRDNTLERCDLLVISAHSSRQRRLKAVIHSLGAPSIRISQLLVGIFLRFTALFTSHYYWMSHSAGEFRRRSTEGIIDNIDGLGPSIPQLPRTKRG